MTKVIEREALVTFAAEQMFALVNDIESYPQFLPGCAGANILRRGETDIEARLDLEAGGFSQSFVTRNRLDKPHGIDMQLVDGPFKKLEGRWSFEPVGDQGCKVKLRLEFEFKNKLMALAAGRKFESVANQLVDAICQRAQTLYG